MVGQADPLLPFFPAKLFSASLRCPRSIAIYTRINRDHSDLQ